MKYFLDTEFIEDGRTIDLVSIGIVCEDGREYYAVSTEADLTKANPWVRENVLPHLPKYGDPAWKSREQIAYDLAERPREHNRVATNRPFVRGDGDGVEVWAYFGDYDWVALCQLFGTMSDLPDVFPMYCHDLKQAMSRDCVDVTRDQLPPQVDEHDALADARWVRDAYLWMQKGGLL